MDSSQPIVIDVNQSTRKYYFDHPLRGLFLIVVPILVSIGFAYVEYLAGTFSSSPNQDAQNALILILVPLSIPLVSWIQTRSKMQTLFYTELATALNCTYTARADTPTEGHLFSLGNQQFFAHILSGTYSTTPVRVGDYEYITGSGKNKGEYYYTLAELAVPGPIPSIICVPANWPTLLINKWQPSGYEPLKLEGDFNTKFAVYVPQGKEMEALQILEPDLMLKLMDGFQDFAFECVGTHVYLFRNGTMKENRENVLRVFSFVERFSQILLPELQKFSGTPSA